MLLSVRMWCIQLEDWSFCNSTEGFVFLEISSKAILESNVPLESLNILFSTTYVCVCVCVLLFRDGKDGAIARLLGSVKMSKCVIPENAVLKRAYFSESSLQVSVACVKGENWLLTIPSVPLSETNLPLLKLNSIWTLHLAKGMKIRMMTLHNKAFEQPELQIQVPADHAMSGCWFLCLCDQWIRLSRELSKPIYPWQRRLFQKPNLYPVWSADQIFNSHDGM